MPLSFRLAGTSAALIAVALVAGACLERRLSLAEAPSAATKPAAPPRWPALPLEPAAARALVKARTKRPPGEEVAQARILAVVLAAARGEGRALIGWPTILGELAQKNARARRAGRDHFLLFGSYHDAGGQLAAFGRMIGPGALGRLLSHVVVEQLDADGRWAKVGLAAQRGDSALLHRWAREGHRPSLDALGQRQVRQNYTAWKYGYLQAMTDLLVSVRAADRPLLGCDMPRELQKKLAGLTTELRDRLRELHCLMGLDHATRDGGRRDVAMFWGQSHVELVGVPRFLAADVELTRVRLLGHRPGQGTSERALAAAGLTVLAPVMIEHGSGSWILLLPGPVLGGVVDRARDPVEVAQAPKGKCRLTARSNVAGTLIVGKRRVELRAARERHLEVAARPDAAPLRFIARGKRKGRLLVGQLDLPARGGVELDLEPTRRSIRVVYHPVVVTREATGGAPAASSAAAPTE